MYLCLGIVITIILTIVVPFLIGNWITGQMDGSEKGLSLSILTGNMALFGMFEIMALPAVFAGFSFHTLLYAWMTLIILLCVLSIVKSKGKMKDELKKTGEFLKHMPWHMILAFILVILQALVYIRYMHLDGDDAFYVGTSTTTLETDTMYRVDPYTGESYGGHIPARYILSPLPVYWAVLSKLSGIHPAILTHSLIPALLVVFAYMVYYNWGKRLFTNQVKNISIFLIFLSILHMFGNVSLLTDSVFLLVRVWQGKSILAMIIIPFIMYLCLRITEGKNKRMDWFMLLVSVTAACMVSSMGIFLSPIVVGTWAVLLFLKTRKIHHFFYYVGCCMPCIILGMMYVMIK